MGYEDLPSIRDPQLVPSDHIYVILQDHGPRDGGWGPASLVGVGMPPGPAIYTGSDEVTLFVLRELAENLARQTGKPTRFSCFTSREDLASFGEE